MTDITIYTKPICPYCVRAKELLSMKGYTEFHEIDISTDPTRLDDMLAKSGGRRTVPQIFINGTHVGGFDDLAALNNNGELEALLKKA